MAPSGAHHRLEPTGLISQPGFFWLLPFHFQSHFSSSEKTFQVQTSLNTSQLLQFAPISSPSPSSCKEKESSLCSGRHPDLELQGQHIHQAPEARTMLHTLICSGDPALAEGTLQRKPHTPITKPRMETSHQPLLAMLHPQEGFWRGGCALSLPVPLSSSDLALFLPQHILFLHEGRSVPSSAGSLQLSKAQTGKQGLLGSSVERHRGKGSHGCLNWDVCVHLG